VQNNLYEMKYITTSLSFMFYGCIMWSVFLKVDRKSQVSERSTFGPEEDELDQVKNYAIRPT
jgi:hypothetical protein